MFDEVHGDLLEPAVYEFDAEGVHLSRIIEGKTRRLVAIRSLEIEEGSEILLQNSRIDYSQSTTAATRRRRGAARDV